MIKVEGYKAFHGDMMITPKNSLYSAFCIVDKNWLYKPEFDCWYENRRSFPAEICTPIEEKHEE